MSQTPDLDRRRFLGSAAATVAAGQLGLLAFSRRLEAMTQPITEVSTSTATDTRSDVRPLHVSFPEEQLADLRRRIKATKWPEKETVADETQGVQLATMQALANYWANTYDWRKAEARINSYPNFVTNIDGLDIHYIHVKSKEKNALPIIITHGWPGSFIEQMKVIEPLTNPTKYGASSADAFDVVIPSLPGYGFSGKPTSPGWNPVRIAKAWTTLMRNLGYKKFVAQGGDWGNAVTEIMALQ
ncbi:MAG TPA: epoxide hydrolase, partial [Gemmatimonadaceae bacterium]|nr:epoxide hydrolase [Gemmatimonadaceae bacterium]